MITNPINLLVMKNLVDYSIVTEFANKVVNEGSSLVPFCHVENVCAEIRNMGKCPNGGAFAEGGQYIYIDR